jgi:hypothetical protein
LKDLAGSYFKSPTVRLYAVNPEPPAGAADDAAGCVPGAGGFGAADDAAGGGAAVDVAAGGAAAVDDGATDLVVEDVDVPVQPVNITTITTIPTSAEKNFLTLKYLLLTINTPST